MYHIVRQCHGKTKMMQLLKVGSWHQTPVIKNQYHSVSDNSPVRRCHGKIINYKDKKVRVE